MRCVPSPDLGRDMYVKQMPFHAGDGMDKRLADEVAAYNILEMVCPEIVPARYHGIIDPEDGIAVEALERVGKVPITDMIGVVLAMQEATAGVVADSPPVKQGIYFWQSIAALKEIRRQGTLHGISDAETHRLARRLGTLEAHLNYFDPAFVHTDAQKRHFGYSADDPQQAKVFDFDQAHIGPRGSELEDLAWIMTRHPESRAEVTSVLAERFAEDATKTHNLPGALKFFETYFLLKGRYDRLSQPRGTTFDTVASVIGRVAGQSLPLFHAVGSVMETSSRATPAMLKK